MRMLTTQTSEKSDTSVLRDSSTCTKHYNAIITDKSIHYNHFRENIPRNTKNLSLKASTSLFIAKPKPKVWDLEKKSLTDTYYDDNPSTCDIQGRSELETLAENQDNEIIVVPDHCTKNVNERLSYGTVASQEAEQSIETSLLLRANTQYFNELVEENSHLAVHDNLKVINECNQFGKKHYENQPLQINCKRNQLRSKNHGNCELKKERVNNPLKLKIDEPIIFGVTNTNILSNKPIRLIYDSHSDVSIEDSRKKVSYAYKLSLSTQTIVQKLEIGEENCINDIIQRRKRRANSISIFEEEKITAKRKKIETMSVYDPRLQSEDRSVGNGFISRGSHNDESSTALGNHYYHCSQPTIATLCNIGNTCYLNSVVYTLRFAPLFLHNLHHLVEDLSHIHHKIGKRAKSSSLGRNVSGLQMENVRSWSSKDLASLENATYDAPKSHQQIATEKLHELYQNLHRNELIETTEPFHADTFLHAIQEVSTIFEGNQQQDAHEFLMCVLDSIRETCQQVIKSISECPDLITNGLPEHTEISQPVATKERERDSSIIKTSFFSRRSKRKDDTKPIKNLRINSPLKDNSAVNNLTFDQTDGSINSRNCSNLISTTEDISSNDKERLDEKIKKLGLDFFTEDFEGITVSTTKCLSCETVTEQKETMIDIAVPISGYENMDISEKSQSFIQNSCITREYFRGENKYRCEQCIGYTEAIRSISYEVLPRLLVIQLSRFSGGMEKINSYLPTPFTLQCFCAKCCEQPENKKLHVYKLYSVITHVGATMSVGHYIAYTCSLDWASDYVNCPKDRKRQAQINSLNTAVGNSSSSSSSISSSNITTNVTSEKNLGLMKKMRFGRSKASSSGDMSKNMKNMNGLSNKTITNGVEKLNISTTCQSVNCCGIRIKNSSTASNTNYNNGSCSGNNNNNNNGLYMDITDENSQSSLFNTANAYGDTINYSSGNKTKSTSQPTWYMCDDDKIKAMSQREFEDLLSPNRKIMVTPYLLFYARSDLQ